MSDKNYKGTLEEKVKAWGKDHVVNKQDLKKVLIDIINEAKEKTYNFGLKEINRYGG